MWMSLTLIILLDYIVYCGFNQYSLNMKFHRFPKLLRQSKKNKCSSKMWHINYWYHCYDYCQEFMLPWDRILLNLWKLLYCLQILIKLMCYLLKKNILLLYFFKGIYHDVSEDTHWGEFLNVSINYINKLPKPWDMVSTI